MDTNSMASIFSEENVKIIYRIKITLFILAFNIFLFIALRKMTLLNLMESMNPRVVVTTLILNADYAEL